MGNWDIIDLCLRNLLRRRTRTLLAVAGVVIGTCAIIVMVSIGFGLSEGYQQQIASYGDLHMITVMSNEGGGMADPKSEKGKITDKTLENMRKIKGVDAVTPVVSEYMIIGLGKKIVDTEVVGVIPEVLEKFNYEVDDGRLLNNTDKMTILFGNQVPTWFYDPNKDNGWSDEPEKVITDKLIITADMNYKRKNVNNLESDNIQYSEYKAKGVGVLSNPNDESAYCVYMNIKDVEKMQKEAKAARKETSNSFDKGKYQKAFVYVGNIDKAEDVTDILRDDMGFQTYSSSDWLKQAKETSKMIQTILGGIGGVSLLVAALGITNTMVMSIYERTREIGVMKVIGANLADIKKMFLLEAGMIGFIGGTAGVILSFIISILLNTLGAGIMSSMLGGMGMVEGSSISVIPWWMIVAALTFSTAIGVIAGYSPAKRAMNLSALESLRNE